MSHVCWWCRGLHALAEGLPGLRRLSLAHAWHLDDAAVGSVLVHLPSVGPASFDVEPRGPAGAGALAAAQSAGKGASHRHGRAALSAVAAAKDGGRCTESRGAEERPASDCCPESREADAGPAGDCCPGSRGAEAESAGGCLPVSCSCSTEEVEQGSSEEPSSSCCGCTLRERTGCGSWCSLAAGGLGHTDPSIWSAAMGDSVDESAAASNASDGDSAATSWCTRASSVKGDENGAAERLSRACPSMSLSATRHTSMRAAATAGSPSALVPTSFGRQLSFLDVSHCWRISAELLHNLQTALPLLELRHTARISN